MARRICRILNTLIQRLPSSCGPQSIMSLLPAPAPTSLTSLQLQTYLISNRHFKTTLIWYVDKQRYCNATSQQMQYTNDIKSENRVWLFYLKIASTVKKTGGVSKCNWMESPENSTCIAIRNKYQYWHVWYVGLIICLFFK